MTWNEKSSTWKKFYGLPFQSSSNITQKKEIIMKIIKNDFLTELQAALKALMNQHTETITPSPDQSSQTSSVRHHIPLTNTTSFRLSNYRYSEEKRKEINQQVREMLRLEIIKQCVSLYSSLMVLVKKKNGIWRFCVYYRRLNSFTEDSTQPIPLISDALRDLKDLQIFRTLDLKPGYWQIPLT
uniref:Reverse transcriptase domain-containing protein n=1 Tax=Trichogramma kaykai TaxID=54128 RepID=A0ABD2VWC5_9HYME